MSDWLTTMIKSNLEKANPETPFEQLLVEQMRKNLEKYEARQRAKAMTDADDGTDWLTRELQPVLDSMAQGDVTLQQDARDVLGDALGEVEDELLEELERLRVSVKRSESGAMVLKSDDSDNFWTNILLDQVRGKLRQKAQRGQIDAAEYREWLQAGDEAMRAEGKDSGKSWAEEFGNPQS
jgi:hypothetical protein